MSILFHHYKELTECIEQVEEIEARVNNKHRLTKEEEGREEDLLPWIVIFLTRRSLKVNNNLVLMGI